MKSPTFGNGKICYLEIPSDNVDRSAEFYKEVFGWNIRERSDGQLTFDDGVGEVSGTWVTGRKPATEGIAISIMIDDIAATVALIRDGGGKILEEVNESPAGKMAHFSDPYGNTFGLYQQRPLI